MEMSKTTKQPTNTTQKCNWGITGMQVKIIPNR